jgi:hypothetical protein
MKKKAGIRPMPAHDEKFIHRFRTRPPRLAASHGGRGIFTDRFLILEN